MNLKRSPFAIQDKNQRDLDTVIDYPAITDLMKEQNVSSDDSKTIHYRRDLDSLGWFILIGYCFAYQVELDARFYWAFYRIFWYFF